MVGAYRLMKANRKSLQIKVGLIVALMILVSVSGMTLIRIQQFAESSNAVEETYLVIESLHQILLDVKDAESAQRGYLLTGHADFLLAHDAVAQRLAGRIATLRERTLGHLKQQEEIPVLQDMIMSRMAALAEGIAMFKAPILDRKQVIDLIQGQGASSMATLHVQVHRMLAAEENELKRRAALVSGNAASSRQWIFFGNLFAVALLLYGVWAILREVDQRRIAQRDTQKSMAQLELTNKELESFSYSVSHDLRSPLRAIDGYSRILQEDYAEKLDDEGRRILSVVRDSSKKMGMLIDDLLTFSKLGRKPVELRKIDMNELVEEVWRDVAAHTDQVPAFKKEYLPPCCGDRALVRQVLFNLLSNAVKYSSTVSNPAIDMFATEEEHETIYSVRDNGVGFDMRFYDKLFGVFQRLHSESEFPGTGVGLAIVKRVVVRHGGRVWAKSEPAKETVFNFSLPIEVSA